MRKIAYRLISKLFTFYHLVLDKSQENERADVVTLTEPIYSNTGPSNTKVDTIIDFVSNNSNAIEVSPSSSKEYAAKTTAI